MEIIEFFLYRWHTQITTSPTKYCQFSRELFSMLFDISFLDIKCIRNLSKIKGSCGSRVLNHRSDNSNRASSLLHIQLLGTQRVKILCDIAIWEGRPAMVQHYLRAVLFKRGHGDERGQSNPYIGKEVYSHPPLVSLIKCFPLSFLFLLIFSATGQSLFPDSDHPTMHWGLWSVSHN